jgi:hypothetical protein
MGCFIPCLNFLWLLSLFQDISFTSFYFIVTGVGSVPILTPEPSIFLTPFFEVERKNWSSQRLDEQGDKINQ